MIARDPKRHMTVVVLTNRNEPEPYQLALKIARAVIAFLSHGIASTHFMWPSKPNDVAMAR